MYTEAWVVLTCGNDTVYNRVLERVQYSVVPSDPRRIRKDGTRIEFPVSVETQRATTQARILGQRFLEDRLDPQDRREVEMSVRTKVKEQKLTEGTSFTPGPWTLEAGRTIQTRSGKFHLAYRTDPQTSEKEFSSPTELDANARLIAAAPDLLNACVAMGEKVPWVHNAGVTEDIEALRAVCLAYADVWNNLMSQAIDKAGVEYNTNEARQVVGAIIESVHSRPAPRLRPLRERMTRAEIESEFDVRDGVIKDPGKFEGEPVYAPYFYVLGMDSGADEDVYGADDTIHSVFFITDEDREQFPELKEEEIEALHVWEGETGFFNTEAVTREEWEAFKAQHESDEDEEFAESHNRPDSVRPPQTGETVYVGDVAIEFTRGGWYVVFHMAKDSDGEFLKKMKFDTWASALEYANSVADDEDFEESRQIHEFNAVRSLQPGESRIFGDVSIEYTLGGWFVVAYMATDDQGSFRKTKKFYTFTDAVRFARSVSDEDFDESCRKGKKGKRVAPKLRGKSQSDGKPQKVEAKPLSRTPQDHQTAIAIRTLKMAAPMAGVMGGPSKEEARRYLLSIGWSQAKIDALTQETTIESGESFREADIAEKMKAKGYQYAVVFPGGTPEPLYVKTAKQAAELIRTDYADTKGIDILPIDKWIARNRGKDESRKRKIDYGRLHQQGAKPETFNMPQHTVKGE